MVPFEGAEKKCEVMVRPDLNLRSLPSDFWTALVAACDAEILSTIQNEHCDAYLLSESSLFVWPHRLLLITCGRTRLARSVHFLLDRLGESSIDYLLYQRKNEYYSHLQHTSFEEDVAGLHARVPGTGLLLGSRDSHYTQVFHIDAAHRAPEDDRTCELLMHHLGAEASAALTRPGLSAEAIRAFLRLDDILPGAILDDFVFDPFGYSLNALRGEDYLTVHITPERDGSYVSLETSIDLAPFLPIPLQVLGPRSFDLVLYNPLHVEALLARIPHGYTPVCRQSSRLPSEYRVEFAHFARPETP